MAKNSGNLPPGGFGKKSGTHRDRRGVADMGFARCGFKCTCCAKGFSPHHKLATQNVLHNKLGEMLCTVWLMWKSM